LRRVLHTRGFRYRVDHRIDLPGGRVRPDIAFTKWKVAVFCDGCFWHVCPEHATYPVQNRDFWSVKLARNVERDRSDTARLEAAGWIVVRIWEHEPIDQACSRVADAVEQRRST